ncbi:hypothetical protein FI667_g5868, partial [Globisporangium splendens]
MERVVADGVPTANVLRMTAERTGKTSSNGDEIQRICDYLVKYSTIVALRCFGSKHWFQTAGDLRVAQFATEEWHSLQIPSRLKIAVQQVLDGVECMQEPASVSYGYGQQYYYAADGSIIQHQGETAASGWPSDQSAAGYEGYYYGHSGSPYPSAASSEVSSPTEAYECQYSGFASAPSDGDGSYAAGYAHVQGVYAAHDSKGYYEHSASVISSNSPEEQPKEATEVEYPSETYASDQDVVEAHAVVVEDATTYEEILASTARHDPPPLHSQPQEWSCRQCAYLNPMTESFCEMCADHISVPVLAASPATTSGHGTATTMPSPLPSYAYSASGIYGPKISSESPPPAVAVVISPSSASLALRHSLQSGGAGTLQNASTPPLSPLYAPSAPSYDDAMAYEDAALSPAVVAVATVLSPSFSCSAARQLAFQTSDDDTPTVLIHPTKAVLLQPQQQADFLALAFNKEASNGAKGSDSSSPMAAKHDQVRRSEDACTECSF